MIATFRMGPVEVEAVQLTRENGPTVWEWADSKPWYGPDRQVGGLSIYTRFGRKKADFGDWVVKDASGNFYPVKPDVFEDAYEPVEAAQQSGEAPSR